MMLFNFLCAFQHQKTGLIEFELKNLEDLRPISCLSYFAGWSILYILKSLFIKIAETFTPLTY